MSQYQSPRLVFVDRPLSLDAVAAECDLAILNANHATTAEMLLAGKPLFQLPLTLEQLMLAQRTVDIGAAVCLPMSSTVEFAKAIEVLIDDTRFTSAAETFAQRHATFDSNQAIEKLVERLESLCG